MKTEQTFTPGPWSWVVEGVETQLQGPLSERICDFGEQNGYGDNTAGSEPSEANKRLIAAAPCLYEACRKGLAVAEAHALDCNPNGDLKPGDSADYDAAMVMVGVFKAALDKATGSKP